MDTLFHLVFGFIAGMAVNVRLKHRPVTVFGVALVSVLIDIDHLLFAYPRTFHSLFVIVPVSVAVFYSAYRYERGTDRIMYQSLSLLLFVMLVGHVVADMFNEGGVKLLYPFVETTFTVPQWTLTVFQQGWAVVSPDGIALAVCGGIIALAYYTEQFIYFFENQHETLRQAIDDLSRV